MQREVLAAVVELRLALTRRAIDQFFPDRRGMSLGMRIRIAACLPKRKSPPLVGIFAASPHVGRKRECVVGATGIEPVTPTMSKKLDWTSRSGRACMRAIRIREQKCGN